MVERGALEMRCPLAGTGGSNPSLSANPTPASPKHVVRTGFPGEIVAKHIVVTGAGTGIGRAIAEHLAECDHSILLIGRNRASLEETQRRLKHAEKHQCFSCDIRIPRQISAALEESGIESLFGVVANAGVFRANIYGKGDCWQEIIDTNLTGSYHTIQECLPYLRQDPAPFRKVLVTSSVLARIGVPAHTAYSASKAGLLGLMRSLAAELASDRILVNAICPSYVDTDMARHLFEAMGNALGISAEAACERAMTEVPLGKMSTPMEIARLVGFLMSEEETSITGQAIDINNGVLMV